MILKVYLPQELSKYSSMHFQGLLNISSDGSALTVYVTQFSPISPENHESKTADFVLGFWRQKHVKSHKSNVRNFIEIVNNQEYKIHKLIINYCYVKEIESCVMIFYDKKVIESSEISMATSMHGDFSELQKIIGRQNVKLSSVEEGDCGRFLKELPWLNTSMFVCHIMNYFGMMFWLFKGIKQQKRVSIKHGNLILAIVMDIVIGYTVVQLVNSHSKHLSIVKSHLEIVVDYLRSLMQWLMGAPAGLKLNKAFNNMLGKFFLYHINLWSTFLELVHQGLDVVFYIYQFVGYLGFTFQAALFSDMILFLSFHVYCIYVYAARLFNLQVSGIIALTRLFVGRKYNPLRNLVDSYEYTNEELFVGTVAFTILLFLLPTTAVYYIVFTLFRLVSLTVQGILARMIYYIQNLPLYVTLLWLCGSSRVSGNISIEVVKNTEGPSPLILNMKMKAMSLGYLVKTFQPSPYEIQKPLKITEVLSNAIRGNLISPL